MFLMYSLQKISGPQKITKINNIICLRERNFIFSVKYIFLISKGTSIPLKEGTITCKCNETYL